MTTTQMLNYCIALQPICDRKMRHVADELLYRAHGDATSATIDDHQKATARVCNVAFYETGLRSLVGSRKLFVNVPHEWLLKPELLPPEPDQVVVEVLEDVMGTPDVINALHKIRRMGYEIALDDFTLTPESQPLLNVADIVKVDVTQPMDIAHLQLLKESGKRLLAEKVEDLDTFNRMSGLGFELFQGYFYAKPETQKLTLRKRTNHHPALMRLLSELRRGDVNYKDLEDLIAQDAQLTYVLLKHANSAMLHHRGEIVTVTQALNALGLRRVQATVITILLADNGPTSRLLLSQALTRAAMCERVADESGQDPDAAFTVGLISMMGLLLDEPLAELLEKLPISQEAADAILLRSHGLGKILNLVEQFECGKVRDWSPDVIDLYNHIWLESQVWTTQTLAAIDNTV